MTYQVQNQLRGNAIYVDAVNGDDTNGAAGKADLPFLTIGAALAVASAGDTVQVLPGDYAESGLTIPASVSLIGVGGYEVTSITGAAATGTRVNMSTDSTLANFTLTVPTDAVGAVDCDILAGNVCGVRFLKFTSPLTGVGSGITVNSGKLIGLELRQGAGTAGGMLNVLGGVLAAQAIHIPPGATLPFGAAVSGGGRLQALDFNIGSPDVTYGMLAIDGTAILLGVNFFNCDYGIRVADNTANVEAYGGKIQASIANLLVDPALTGVGGKVRITAQMDRKFDIPDTWIDSDHAWTFFTSSDNFDNTSYQLWGANFVVGHPEYGSSVFLGEGSAYGTSNTVFTTNSTGSAGYIDVSTEAASKDGSTFTFQTAGTGAVGETIMWCTNRTDASSNKLKHWTAEFSQTTAAVGGSFVFEIYNGSSWVEIGVEALEIEHQYRYADQVFLRANATEDCRLGIDGSTTWPSSTINAVDGHWARVRIATLPTTAPVFEQLKLVPSRFCVNQQGQIDAQGLAQWKQTLYGSGNSWGLGAGTTNTDVQVSTSLWTQENVNSRFNSSGDYMTFQFAIPGGLSTAHPLSFTVLYSTETGSTLTDATLTLNVLPVAVIGNLIADSGGGVVPVARSVADGEDYNANAPQSVAFTNEAIHVEKIKALTFSGYDISSYYEGDILILQLVGTNGAGPTIAAARPVDIWAIVVEGVQFSPGKVI